MQKVRHFFEVIGFRYPHIHRVCVCVCVDGHVCVMQDIVACMISDWNLSALLPEKTIGDL